MLIEELGKVENDKNLSLQKLQNAKDRLVQIDTSSQQLEGSVGDTKNKYESAIVAQDKSQGQLALVEQAYQEADKEFSRLSSSFEDLRQREKEIKSAVSANQLLKETLGREIEALLTRQSILKTDISMMESRKEEINKGGEADRQELEQQAKELAEIEKQLEEKATSSEKLEAELAEIQSTSAAAVVEVNEKYAERAGIEQRVKFIKNIIENNEGLPESVKFILKKKGKDYNVFSDVIEIKDEKYTNIIELFLEPYFYHVIAADRAEGIKLYEQVRDAQKGKIKVIIADELPKAPLTAPREGLIPLQDLVKADSTYTPYVRLISQEVFVTDQSYKSVDLSALGGDATVLFAREYLIYTGGKLYGGSNTLFEGVQLGRKKILEKLETKLGKLSKVIKSYEEKAEKQKSNQTTTQEKLVAQKEEFEEIRKSLEASRGKFYQIESKISHLDGSIQDLDQGVQLKKEELVQVEKDLELKNNRYSEIQAVKVDEMSDQELTQKIEDAHKAYLAAGATRDQTQSSLFEIRSTFNLAAKDLEFHKNTLGDISVRIDALREEKTTQQEIISTTEVELKDIKQSLQDRYEKKAEIQSKLSQYEDTYYKEKGKIFELEKKISEFRSELYKKDHLISELSEKYTQIGFEIKGIHERNSIEFGVEIKENEFPEEYEGLNLENLKTKKTKIQERIRSFGEINPMAITAYNEIKERHDQISKEKDDILAAKDSLEETISEIETAASERFNDSLNRIRVSFKSVFQSLFSKDDDCDIVLLDNEDPLEAKIEIIAKPKGKRPKSISSLSGGEKTLTAASFLFALYLLKPAPFCIFDEVDAPLDDVNVLKFNKIIREFSQDSQFIVITHNKLTMSEVDILYGVYLKELGVSGVSAVDFRTYDQTEMVVTS